MGDDRVLRDVAAVLQHYGAGDVPEGRWRTMRCPFSARHSRDDRSASARVNTEIDGFACHGCGVKGDSLKIIMEVESVRFEVALRRYSEITGEEVPQLQRTAERGAGGFTVSGEPRVYGRGPGIVPAWVRDRA